MQEHHVQFQDHTLVPKNKQKSFKHTCEYNNYYRSQANRFKLSNFLQKIKYFYIKIIINIVVMYLQTLDGSGAPAILRVYGDPGTCSPSYMTLK